MKVLVTGGAGYIGSVTAERLLDAGHEVVVFDSLERGHREAVDARARFEKGDLRDRDRIAGVVAQVRPDAVMHFAAYALVEESMKYPERYFGNNVGGGIHLAEAMVRAGVGRIVFSSTCATYGQPDRVPIAEDTPQRPCNPYGESKLIFERILSWYRELKGMTTVFLRYFNACGATGKFGEDHDPETHLIPIVLDVAAGRREQVMIYGDDYDTPDGTCLRDYIHVCDLADAHIRALSVKESVALNLGHGTGHSVKQVIEAARRITGRAIPARVAARRPGDPPRLIAAAEKAKAALGWRPVRSEIDEIIRTAWAWRQAHPRGYAG
jgi:UDP-glucose 4-epimerase